MYRAARRVRTAFLRCAGRSSPPADSDRLGHAGEPRAEGEINRFKDERAAFCVAFSPDSKLIVAGGNGKVARLWDIESGKLIRTFEGHHTPVWCVAFSADGKHLLTGSGGHDPDAV